MRKSFIVFASLIALVMFADNASAQVKFGAGYSMADHSLKYGDSDEGYALHGFNVGLTYDANVIDWKFLEFGVVLGVNYELMTDEKSENLELFSAKLKRTVTEHYINVPLNLNLGLNIIPGIFGVYAFGGPVLSFGVNSNTEVSVDTQKGRGRLTYNNYNGQSKADNLLDGMTSTITSTLPTDYGWFDVKLGVGAGIEIVDAIDLKAGYNWGLVNRYTGDSKDVSHHSDQFYVTLSYIF